MANIKAILGGIVAGVFALMIVLGIIGMISGGNKSSNNVAQPASAKTPSNNAAQNTADTKNQQIPAKSPSSANNERNFSSNNKVTLTKTYIDKEHGYKFNYPENWIITEELNQNFFNKYFIKNIEVRYLTYATALFGSRKGEGFYFRIGDDDCIVEIGYFSHNKISDHLIDMLSDDLTNLLLDLRERNRDHLTSDPRLYNFSTSRSISKTDKGIKTQIITITGSNIKFAVKIIMVPVNNNMSVCLRFLGSTKSLKEYDETLLAIMRSFET
jgi:hypothetical protein